MATNIAGLKKKVSELLGVVQEMVEAKQEAIGNCESDSRTEKLEEQLAILESVLQYLGDAEGELDGWV